MTAEQREQFMREAIALSIENVRTGRGGPFGTVIAKDGKVIARAANRVTDNFDPTAHAEVEAIRAACKALGAFQLTGCELFTSCEPCPMCLGAIYWARLDRFFYGNSRADAAKIEFDDSFIYDEISKRPEGRTIPGAPLLSAEAAEGFAEWARSAKKVPY
jgi:tRNA(Arg) A34 adenosine deaminase TadA